MKLVCFYSSNTDIEALKRSFNNRKHNALALDGNEKKLLATGVSVRICNYVKLLLLVLMIFSVRRNDDVFLRILITHSLCYSL